MHHLEFTNDYYDPYWYVQEQNYSYHHSFYFKIKDKDIFSDELFESIKLYKHKFQNKFEITITPVCTSFYNVPSLNLKILKICQNHLYNLLQIEKVNADLLTYDQIYCDIKEKARNYKHIFQLKKFPNHGLVIDIESHSNAEFIDRAFYFLSQFREIDYNVNCVISKIFEITKNIHFQLLRRYAPTLIELHKIKNSSIFLLPYEVLEKILKFSIGEDTYLNNLEINDCIQDIINNSNNEFMDIN